MQRAPNKTRPLHVVLLGAACLLLSRGVDADAPTGHFDVNGDVVTDSKTKLEWQRKGPEEPLGLTKAASYCGDLELSGSGWRLPTIKELHTLVDETRTLPSIDTNVFPRTPTAFFWSSTRVATFNQYVWAVSFAEGTDAWFAEETARFVRCVR